MAVLIHIHHPTSLSVLIFDPFDCAHLFIYPSAIVSYRHEDHPSMAAELDIPRKSNRRVQSSDEIAVSGSDS
jgi:hypothetical protein